VVTVDPAVGDGVLHVAARAASCDAHGGEGGKRIPLDVKAGDRILFGKYSGQELKVDGHDYFIMKEDDVLAVIEGPTSPTKKKK
jgi:co-chaperonin GroES (HSP10)